MAGRLDERLRDRVGRALRPGWARSLLLRRILAGALVLLAAALVIRDDAGSAGVAVVVATRDLAPGVPVGESDLVMRRVDPGSVPSGALTTVAAAVGRPAVGAVRAGETLTDVRLLGPALVAAAAEPGAVSVAVRLADAGVAELLRPGDRVGVVRGGGTDTPAQVAENATVLLVPPPDAAQRQGRLVVLALPPGPAGAVASASLAEPLTVTFGRGGR